MKGFRSIFILIALAVVLIIWGMGLYNGLVSKEETVTEAWAQVENVYQRRADLIPNLVATVKGYADFEQETLIAVIEARAKATGVTIDPSNIDPQALQQFQQAQDGLGSALSRLLVVIERYPDLKANQNFLELQAQLEGTENRIAVERKRFNEVAKTYNVSVRRFPQNLFAKMFGFENKAYFEAAEGADEVPVVEF